jgi:hypothetical protein
MEEAKYGPNAREGGTIDRLKPVHIPWLQGLLSRDFNLKFN